MRRAMYGSFEESMLHVMAHLPVVVVFLAFTNVFIPSLEKATRIITVIKQNTSTLFHDTSPQSCSPYVGFRELETMCLCHKSRPTEP